MGKQLARIAPILGLVMLWAVIAAADVTRVYVTSSGPMGTFGGREYIWANAQMEGTVARPDGSTGKYRVPIVLMYPDRNSNGVGFVDVPNSAVFLVYKEQEAPGGKRFVFHVGDTIFSDYLKRGIFIGVHIHVGAGDVDGAFA